MFLVTNLLNLSHAKNFLSRGESRMVTDVCHEFSFLSRIFEFSNCFFTRRVAEGHELSNYRIFFMRRVAEGHGFLSRDLSFGPTDQREVIIGLSNCFFTWRVAEVTDYRIIEFSSHGESRKVTELFFFITNYRIFELILSITRRIAEGHGFLSRIIETCP